MVRFHAEVQYGDVLELVYSLVLETRAERHVGSSPTILTNKLVATNLDDMMKLVDMLPQKVVRVASRAGSSPVVVTNLESN